MFKLRKESILATLVVYGVLSAYSAAQAQSVSSSSSSSTSSTSSSSTSSSTSSSGGYTGPGYEYNNQLSVCAEISDGTTVDDQTFDPDNYAGSVVIIREYGTNFFGGPTSDSGLTINYSNGTDGDLPMAVYYEPGYIQTIDFPPTGGWDIYEAVDLPYYGHLNLASLTEAGGPNIGTITAGFTINRQTPTGWGLQVSEAPPCPSVQPPKPVEVTCELGTPSVWADGYVVSNLVIRNDGDRVIDTWSATLQFATAPQMTNYWNAEFSEYSSNRIYIRPLSWNEVIAPGESVHLGFMGSHDGDFELPTCSVTRSSY